jgi:signal transduction histidine kinase/ligand-binding sensor domain-containing protein
LPQDRIACIQQTDDGYLWLGTWYGLARFDGVRFTTFDHANVPEFSGERGDCINALAKDHEGSLWIATTGNGLVKYCDRHFEKVAINGGVSNEAIWRVVSSERGGLWVLAGTWVSWLSEGKLRRLWQCRIPDLVTRLEETHGELNVFTHDVWVTVRNDGTVRTNLQRAEGRPFWGSAIAARDGGIWFGGPSGATHYSSRRGLDRGGDDFSGEPVDFMGEDSFGRDWAAIIGKGLFRRVNNAWEKVELGESLGGVAVACLMEDRNRNIWLGADAGLVELRFQPIRSYSRRDGLIDDDIAAICEDRENTIGIFGDHGISCIKGEAVQTVHSDSDGFVCVCPAADRGFWAMGKDGSLLRFRDRHFQQLLPPGTFTVPDDMIDQGQETLWITGIQGLFQVNAQTAGVSNVGQNYPQLRNVSCVREDNSGNHWIGTAGGLYRLASNRLETIYEGTSIVDMCLRASNEAWVACERGLLLVSNERPFLISTANGLPEAGFNSIVADDFDGLWLGGMKGIYWMPCAELRDIAAGRKQRARSIAFGTDDGMDAPETNGGRTHPGAWKARDGRIWFAMSRGAAVIDPRLMASGGGAFTNSPTVVIESVRADEQAVLDELSGTLPEAPRIQPGHGGILEFRFSATCLVDPQGTVFRYRLTGYDDSRWHESTSERLAHYANLRPGNYKFEVTAVNHRGVESSRPATFAFVILPHFWQTWPFYVLCGASVAGVAIALQSYRLQWQRRVLKLEEQRTLANERARIARDLHDDLGTALTGLALELDVIDREHGIERPRLDKTAQRVRNLAERMREVVWTVNPECDTISSLAGFLEQQVEQFLRVTGLNVHLDFPESIPNLALGAEARHELALSVREAMSNAVKHSKATQLVVRLEIHDHALRILVQDNGCGFDKTGSIGQGLKNLHTRMDNIGGHFECVSERGTGTTIVLQLPLNEGRK